MARCFFPTVHFPSCESSNAPRDLQCLDPTGGGLPSLDDYISIVQISRRTRSFSLGQSVYACIHEHGLEALQSLGNYVVPMLVECGNIPGAKRVFQKLDLPNEISWTSLIQGYTESGEFENAISLFASMQERYVYCTAYTFVAALKASSRLKCVGTGQGIHASIVARGLDNELFVGNALIGMYAKLGLLAEACEAFDRLLARDVVTWNSLMAGYAEHGLADVALHYFEDMQLQGVSPDPITFVCGLKACCSIASLDRGLAMHADVVNGGYEDDPFLGNSLVDMYMKCGSLAEGWYVFGNLQARDAVSWNLMIHGMTENGFHQKALDCLEQMRADSTSPDSVTFVLCLKACTSAGAKDMGWKLHAEVVGKGLESDPFIGTTLVGMYAKFGSIEDAQGVFDKVLVQDLVLWNTLVAGYAEHGFCEKVLDCLKKMQLKGTFPDVVSWSSVILCFSFCRESKTASLSYKLMQEQGLLPDGVTFLNALKACGGLETGKQFHAILCQLQSGDVAIATALLDMYGRFGSMADAQHIFDTMPTKVLAKWNAMMSAYTRQGEKNVVFELFKQMEEEGMQPNDITFLLVLTVCSHTGLVNEGQRYFIRMITRHGINPTIKHHSCMVDLLSRAGQLKEAVMVLGGMPYQQANLVACSTILGACQKWGNVDVARHAFEWALGLSEKDASAFSLMYNIYADAHMWEHAREIELMRAMVVHKEEEDDFGLL